MSNKDFTNFICDPRDRSPITIPIFKDGKYVASMERVRAYDLADKGLLQIIDNEGHVQKDKK